ncbi:DNA primase [Acidihalobacter aeolianus]|uniref:DNA primase n=1 Tax=Acidihalobacter aeolianus TaxID=2792603 RepID=A0A1D8KB30_9GAMM|nr:DNA primase [Acidihalobacter aeolianus]AOV18164.1 DNA primase [Acidihalobacter aeolianus]
MARIPQSFIDELLARTDIVEIINARVPLKRAGHEFKACCPFHNEKTPSFYVSPQKQFYHCFGCGAHGTALSFLIEHDRLDFVEAVESLAAILGLDVPHEGGHRDDDRRSDERAALHRCLEDASAWFKQELRRSQTAVDYLKQRGLDGVTAARFGLGYAPPLWDGLLNAFKGRHSTAHLVEAGLLVERDGRHYDRFRDRIMFPIRDPRGQIIGFGGRVIADGTPKYLNSNETPLFHKGRSLYGLYEARQSGVLLDEILIVEGYMDVISLSQQDIHNVVATLGTATTREHIQRLYRTAKRLIFCFDGDRAGRSAAWRALEQTLPVLEDGNEAVFLFLPDGQDPDSFVRSEGKEAFLKLAGDGLSLSRLLLQELRRRHPGNDMEARAGLAHEGMQLVGNMRAEMLRAQVIEALARETGIATGRLERAQAGTPVPAPVSTDTRAPRHNPREVKERAQTVRWSPLRTAIALLAEHTELAANAPEAEELGDLDNPGVALYAQLLETVRTNPNITTAGILERWRGADGERNLLRLIESRDIHLEPDAARREFDDATVRLLAQQIETRFQLLRRKAQQEGLNAEEKAEFSRLALHGGLDDRHSL